MLSPPSHHDLVQKDPAAIRARPHPAAESRCLPDLFACCEGNASQRPQVADSSHPQAGYADNGHAKLSNRRRTWNVDCQRLFPRHPARFLCWETWSRFARTADACRSQ